MPTRPMEVLRWVPRAASPERRMAAPLLVPARERSAGASGRLRSTSRLLTKSQELDKKTQFLTANA